MKQIIRMMLIAVMLVAVNGTVNAQNTKKQRMTREQLAEAQARRIAGNMAFDDAVSTKFIDTYTRCQKEIWAAAPRQNRRDRQNRQSMTEEQTEQAIKERFAKSQKILDIREKYYAEYSKFLTPKQIERVYQLEKQMMNRLAKNRPNRQKRSVNR